MAEDRQRLEAELSQRTRQLKASETRLHLIIDKNADGIVVVDLDGIVRFVNPATEELLGRPAEELLGQMLGFPLVVGKAAEIDILRGDGTTAVAEMRVVDIEWDGQPASLASLRDITRRKQMEHTMLWRAQTDAAIAELSKALLTQRSLEAISLLILDHAKALTGSTFGYVGYIDPDTGYLVSSTMTRDIWDDCHVAGKDVVFKSFSGLWGWVLEQRQPMLTNDPSQDPRSSGVPQGHLPIERFLSAPALIDQELVGQIALANPDRDYTEQDLELVERLASLYALAVHRQRAEDALAESERRLDQMLQTMVDGMVVVDTQGEIIYANPAAEQILRPGPSGITGRSYDERSWHQIDSQGDPFPADQLPLAITLREQRPVEKFEHGIVTNGDEARWLSVSSAPLRDEGGHLYGAVASFRDITERRQAEQQVEHLNAILRAIRKVDQLIVTEKDRDVLLQGVCDILMETRGYQNVCITLLDDGGEFTRRIGACTAANSLCELIPACISYTLSQNHVVNFSIPGDLCQDCPLLSVHSGNSKMCARLEHRGKIYGVLSVCQPLQPTAEQEETTLFHEMAGDIAFALHNIDLERERIEMERRLQAYAEQLEELVAEKVRELEQERAKTIHTAKLASLGEMATGVAHELNQPLTSMLFDADYLKTLSRQARERPDGRATLEADEVEEIAENLVGDITRCRKIIDHLRAFGRVSAGHATSIDLNRIIRDSFILIGERLKQNDVIVDLELAPDLPPILADPNRVEQVFLNLISNAEYAMKEMEQRIASGKVERDPYQKRLTISTARDGDSVVATVRDTGSGISPEDRERLFEPFFTTKPVGEGTGLGLSISFGIINEIGGEIACESTEDVGTTFLLRFPVGEHAE